MAMECLLRMKLPNGPETAYYYSKEEIGIVWTVTYVAVAVPYLYSYYTLTKGPGSNPMLHKESNAGPFPFIYYNIRIWHRVGFLIHPYILKLMHNMNE